MRKYFGMNRLRKKASWVRFAKTRKKSGIDVGKQGGKGDFMHERTQFFAPFEGEWGDPVLKLVEGLPLPLHYRAL